MQHVKKFELFNLSQKSSNLQKVLDDIRLSDFHKKSITQKDFIR